MKIITKFKNIDYFETERLYATKLSTDDFEKLNLMHTDPLVMETIGGIRTREKTQENLDWNLQQWSDNGFGIWMFYTKDTKEWVGRGGLRRVIVGEQEEIEVSYALMTKFWNQGFATEIAQASVEVAFEVLRLTNIVCFTLTSNKISQRVMEKSGFEHERDIVITYDGIDYHHVLHRMKNYRKADVVPYNSLWPELFANEAKQLQSAFGTQLKEIHHIGSTSIPNMPAKPIIDIMLEFENITDVETIKNQLQPLGYLYVSRQIIPYRSFFSRKQNNDVGYHLHIYEKGDPQIKRHVNFKDYLIHHSVEAKQYADLKLQLAEQFKDDINTYVLGKDKLVQEIDTKAKLWTNRRQDFLSPNTTHTVQNWSEEQIVTAMIANLNVHMTHFTQYLNQIELIRIPGYTLVNSGLPDDTFNYVIDADFPEAVVEQKIDEITDYFAVKNTPFSWWISPYDRPADLMSYLEKKGYQNTENNIAMYFDLDSWEAPADTASPLRIVRAHDEKTLHDFALVLANDKSAFKTYFSWLADILTADDPTEYYVGYIDDKPVVRGLSCYYAGIVSLQWLSTAPDERRHGYATIMQQYRLKRAKELGYHIAVLQASKEGYPLYLKLGYKKCGVFREMKLISELS